MDLIDIIHSAFYKSQLKIYYPNEHTTFIKSGEEL